MCGRFNLRTPASELIEIFELVRSFDASPRYNIAPTQPVLTVRKSETGREPAFLHWGLIPSWSKDPAIGSRMINARAESVASKPSFRSAFRRRRCLIPADGFYEWKKTGPRTKQPYHIRLANGRPFAFAGLWEHWEGSDSSVIESCTIITTDANERLAEVHDRMPVILHRDDYNLWLDPDNDDRAALEALLTPYPAEEVTFDPVSQSVNNPRNDTPECIEPIA